MAAQRVQISAYPDAYAKHEPTATRIVNALADGAARAVVVGDQLQCAGSARSPPPAGPRRSARASVSGFRTA